MHLLAVTEMLWLAGRRTRADNLTGGKTIMSQDPQVEQGVADAEIEPLHDAALEEVAGGNGCSMAYCSYVEPA